ncbi:phosphoglycerate mutase-like protein 1 isoform X2 [Senna tora]|uniref:Phosphoglycerate mutase-like protein 1 isoform X2 n=1 Tax=Senna tora TaxID=362788 RepID=A0A834SI12_9FABA|nr:phosphoglycerate mutase-like protein 1 isoform X2 [Senna tora]
MEHATQGAEVSVRNVGGKGDEVVAGEERYESSFEKRNSKLLRNEVMATPVRMRMGGSAAWFCAVVVAASCDRGTWMEYLQVHHKLQLEGKYKNMLQYKQRQNHNLMPKEQKGYYGNGGLGCICVQISCSSENMDTGPSLYPLHRCKTIHLDIQDYLLSSSFACKSRRFQLIKPYIQVRHAQGIHNVEGEKNYKAYLNPDYFDAHLTPLGWQQVDNLRKHVHASGLIKRIDLVIASPLLRTLQTAVGVFGGEGYTDRMDVLPLMVANAGNSSRAAISSLNCPPIVAVELCREHLGVHPCDKRRSVSEYQFAFPAVDFSQATIQVQDILTALLPNPFEFSLQIDSDEDILWKANVRETKEELAARGLKFMNWLLTRKEKEIAIVTHSGFLFHTLCAFGNDCHPMVKKEICKHFANCELRSMVIVDKSMTGSDASTTNYPGKIPSGPNPPIDVDDESTEK